MIIGKRLHFIWVGSTLPTHLEKNINQWSDLHPHWNVTVWSDKDLNWLNNQDLFDNADSLVPRDAVGQFKADIARYEIIHRYGGFYADCDTYPLRNIEAELDGVSEFAAMETHRWVGNTYLAGVTHHKTFRHIIHEIPQSIKRHRRGTRPNLLTGPKFITPLWRADKCHTGQQAKWFPYSHEDVRRGRQISNFSSGVVCVHDWEHTRDLVKRRKLRK